MFNTNTFLEDGTEGTQNSNPELDSMEPNIVDTSDNHGNENVDYCALHGCKISADDTIITNNDANGKQTMEISFPTAISVCKPSDTSTLNTFNPLEESEPNLDLCMTNQNQDSVVSKNITDSNFKQIITRKCVVKVRNLNPEEIDFLCGPKLLPSFTTDTRSLKMGSTTNSEDLGVKGKSVSDNVPTVHWRQKQTHQNMKKPPTTKLLQIKQ